MHTVYWVLAAFLVGAILGYAFRGKENAWLREAGTTAQHVASQAGAGVEQLGKKL